MRPLKIIALIFSEYKSLQVLGCLNSLREALFKLEDKNEGNQRGLWISMRKRRQILVEQWDNIEDKDRVE